MTQTFPAPEPPYVGPPTRHSGLGNKPIDRVVLHGTVSPCVPGGARNIADYFCGPNARGSAHYVVDPGETLQVGYDSLECWHAPPNEHSIGVEMCDPVGDAKGRPLPLKRWNNRAHRAMLQRTARLVAELCLAYDVPAVMIGPRALRAGKRGICEHSDVSVAFGQSSHWDVGTFPRRRFLRLVRENIAALKGEVAEAEAARARRRARRNEKTRDALLAARRHATSRLLRRRITSCIDLVPDPEKETS